MLKRIPNILSIARIPLSLLLLFVAKRPVLFLCTYLAAGLTDVLDGFLARRFHWESKLGSKLDASADFVFMFSLLGVVFGVLRLKLKLYVLAAMGAVTLLKLANLIFTKLKFKQWSTMHTIANKYTAFPLYVLIPIAVVFNVMPNLAVLVMLVTVFAANVEETLLLARMREYDADMKSLWHLRRQALAEGEKE